MRKLFIMLLTIPLLAFGFLGETPDIIEQVFAGKPKTINRFGQHEYVSPHGLMTFTFRNDSAVTFTFNVAEGHVLDKNTIEAFLSLAGGTHWVIIAETATVTLYTNGSIQAMVCKHPTDIFFSAALIERTF